MLLGEKVRKEMKKYELTISPSYVSSWTVKEAVRELLQNAIDGEKCGHPKSIYYDGGTLEIRSEGVTLEAESLVLGGTSKEGRSDLIGGFHEGMKLAFVVLLREGYTIEIENGGVLWRPSFEVSSTYGVRVLTIEEEDGEEQNEDLVFRIGGIAESLYEELRGNFPCIEEDYGEVVECEYGQILLEKSFRGKMFVEGLYIQKDEHFEFGYNFKADVVELDRDRKAINYHELKTLTASSIITADNCHPKIFSSISNSFDDTKEIKEIIEEASDTFLVEYKEMFYEKRGLEEDTLVATKAVKMQLEQLGEDIEVVEGTEIESYIIAQANDKLGLIKEAEVKIDKKSDIERAFDCLRDSTYQKFMLWINKYRDFLPEEALEEIKVLIQKTAPFNYCRIKDNVPSDFDFSDEAINELERSVLGEEE